MSYGAERAGLLQRQPDDDVRHRSPRVHGVFGGSNNHARKAPDSATSAIATVPIMKTKLMPLKTDAATRMAKRLPAIAIGQSDSPGGSNPTASETSTGSGNPIADSTALMLAVLLHAKAYLIRSP